MAFNWYPGSSPSDLHFANGKAYDPVAFSVPKLQQLNGYKLGSELKTFEKFSNNIFRLREDEASSSVHVDQ